MILAMLVTIVLCVSGLFLLISGIWLMLRGRPSAPQDATEASLKEVIRLNVPAQALLVLVGAALLVCGGYFAVTKTQASQNSRLAAGTPATSTATSPSVSAPSISPAPAVARSPESTKPRPTASAPSVAIEIPKTGTAVSDSKGFAAAGTFSSLGTDTLWIFDYDGGTNYTIDEAANVYFSSRKWSAFDGPGLGSGSLPFSLTMAVVIADSSCNARLNQLSDAQHYNVSSLPSGCDVVAEVTVNVSKP